MGGLWGCKNTVSLLDFFHFDKAAKFRGIAGFHLNEIYSLWVRLSEMVAAFLEAKKLPETLKTFVNISLGETWEDKKDENAGAIIPH